MSESATTVSSTLTARPLHFYYPYSALCGGFQCREETLDLNDQFNITENNIVAACLIDLFSIVNPLRIVGEESSGSSRQVYQYNVNSYQRCQTSQLDTIDVQNSAFTENGGIFRLHLYAETTSKNKTKLLL